MTSAAFSIQSLLEDPLNLDPAVKATAFYAVRANHIVHRLTEDLGAQKMAEIFRCSPSL